MTRFFSCLALLMAMVLVGDALAQRRGGSFGGSRSSPSRSYSSPSRSYSSPSPSLYQRSSPSSSFGGSRSSQPSSSFGGSRSSQPSSSFGGSRSSQPSSLSRSSGSTTPRSYGVPRRETYGGQTYSYKTSGSSAVGVNRSSAMIPRRTISYNDVQSRRNSYYSGVGFAPPTYIGYTSPSYGMFSTLFMLSALHNLQAQQNAMFFYNHWNTASMAAWRNDMQQAAQNDPQAAQRLKQLEARIAELEKEHKGVRDTTYMPLGVDSSVVLSNEALGVEDPEVEKEIRRREAEEQAAMASSSGNPNSSGGGGGSAVGWIVLIGAGVGIWWYFRRRAQNTNSSGGSFS